MTLAASDDNGSNHAVLSPPLTTRPWSDRDCQHDRLVADTLKAHMNIAAGMAVRRPTPVECERLQGFDDDYTNVPFRGKPAADGPRYKAIGNSMAVTKIRWLGKRLAWLRVRPE